MTKLERMIWNLAPLRFVREKSKHIHVPGFQGLPLYDVARFFFKQVKKVGLNERAAAISFNFLMAIPASCIFLFTLVPYLPVSKQFTEELLVLARDITPNYNTYTLVRDFITDFLNTPRSGLLSFGFFLAVFYASNAMIGIMRSFDRSLIPVRKRNFFSYRWMAIKLTALFILLVIATIVVLITQGKILEYILQYFKQDTFAVRFLIKLIRWVVIMALFFYSIAFIYKYGPSVHKRWKLISPGTVLATFLIIATTYLFSFWVNNFNNFNKIYGSIGTIIILMLFIFINSLILLIGFELNVSLTYLRQQSEERVKNEKPVAG